jgi:hypothetical protein
VARVELVGKLDRPVRWSKNWLMPRFHHLWIVDGELEILNPAPFDRPADAPLDQEDRSCGGRIYDELSRYAAEESSPYPAQVVSDDDRWLEVTFPIWAPTRFAALAAGATVLAEACGRAGADTGVLRLAVGESAEELHEYRGRVHEMEAQT